MSKDKFKSSYRKKKIKSSGNYIGNVLKSIKYTGIDAISEMTPSMRSFGNNNSELIADTVKVFRDHKTFFKQVEKQIMTSDAMKSANTVKSNLMADIKSGKLYNRDRIKEIERQSFGSDMGFDSDFDEFTMEDDNGNTSTMRISNSSAKASISVGQMVSQTISKSTVASTEALISNQNAIASMSEAIQSKSHMDTMQGLDVINSNLGNILTYNVEAITPFFETSVKYYEDSVNLLNSINNTLTEIKTFSGGGSKPEIKESTDIKFDDIMSGDSPDLKVYGQLIGKNVKNLLEPVLSTLQLASSLTDGNTFGLLTASPLAFLPKKAVQTLLSKDFKDTLTQLDKTFGNTFGSFIMTMNRLGDEDNSKVLQYMSEIFGLKMKGKTSLDLTNFEKGAVAFDGVTRKTINEVIPNYLRRIESAITGMPERVFDMRKGEFISADEVLKNFEDEKERASLSAVSSQMTTLIDRIDKTMVFNTNDGKEVYDNLIKDVKTTFKEIALSGRGFNPEKDTYDKLDITLEGGEKNFSLIRALVKSLGQEFVMELDNASIMGRDNLNNFFKTIEENQLDAIYQVKNSKSNDIFDKKDGKYKYKANTAGMLADKYGFTTNDYLRDIKGILLDGLITYPQFNFSGGGGLPEELINRRNSFKKNTDEYNNNINREKELKEEGIKTFVSKQQSRYEKNRKAGKDGNRLKDEDLFNLFNLNDVDLDDSDYERSDASGKSLESVRYKKMLGYFNAYNDTQNEIKTVNQRRARAKRKTNIFEELIGGSTVFDKFHIMKNKVNDITEKPLEPLVKIMQALDKKIYQVLYGDEDRSFMNLMVTGFKDSFENLNTFLDDKILTPLNEKLFGDDGLFTKMETWFKDTTLYNGLNNAKEYIFGSKNGDKFEGGFLSDFGNTMLDVKDSATNFITGKEYTSRSTGEKIGTNDNNVMKHVNNTVTSIARATGDTLLGKGQYELDPDTGKMILKGRTDDGLLGVARDQVTDIFNDMREVLFGKDADFDKIKKDMKEAAPSTAAGSVLGALSSLVLPGGPLAGAIIGGVIGHASENESIKKYLLGDKIDGKRQGGKISKEVQDKIAKYAPNAASGGVLGLISSLFLPGGPYAGLLLGSIFGTVVETDKYKDFMHGKIGKDGKRNGDGFAGKMSDYTSSLREEFKQTFMETQLKVVKYLNESIVNPIKDGLEPLKMELKIMGENISAVAKNMWDGLKDNINNIAENLLGEPLGDAFEKYLINPLKTVSSNVFKTSSSILGGVIAAPIGLFNDSMTKARGRHVLDGKDHYLLNEAESKKARLSKQEEWYAKKEDEIYVQKVKRELVKQFQKNDGIKTGQAKSYFSRMDRGFMDELMLDWETGSLTKKDLTKDNLDKMLDKYTNAKQQEEQKKLLSAVDTVSATIERTSHSKLRHENTIESLLGDIARNTKGLNKDNKLSILNNDNGEDDLNLFKGSGKGKYFSQNDKRWRNVSYMGNGKDSSTIGDSGCGPSVGAMVASKVNSKANPMEASVFGSENGFKRDGGTTDNFFGPYLSQYGMKTDKIPVEAGLIDSHLKSGSSLILGGQSDKLDSPYTKSGHYVLADEMKDGKISVTDPRGSTYNRKYDVDDVLNNTDVALSSTDGELDSFSPQSDTMNDMISGDNSTSISLDNGNDSNMLNGVKRAMKTSATAMGNMFMSSMNNNNRNMSNAINNINPFGSKNRSKIIDVNIRGGSLDRVKKLDVLENIRPTDGKDNELIKSLFSEGNRLFKSMLFGSEHADRSIKEIFSSDTKVDNSNNITPDGINKIVSEDNKEDEDIQDESVEVTPEGITDIINNKEEDEITNEDDNDIMSKVNKSISTDNDDSEDDDMDILPRNKNNTNIVDEVRHKYSDEALPFRVDEKLRRDVENGVDDDSLDKDVMYGRRNKEFLDKQKEKLEIVQDRKSLLGAVENIDGTTTKQYQFFENFGLKLGKFIKTMSAIMPLLLKGVLAVGAIKGITEGVGAVGTMVNGYTAPNTEELSQWGLTDEEIAQIMSEISAKKETARNKLGQMGRVGANIAISMRGGFKAGKLAGKASKGLSHKIRNFFNLGPRIDRKSLTGLSDDVLLSSRVEDIVERQIRDTKTLRNKAVKEAFEESVEGKPWLVKKLKTLSFNTKSKLAPYAENILDGVEDKFTKSKGGRNLLSRAWDSTGGYLIDKAGRRIETAGKIAKFSGNVADKISGGRLGNMYKAANEFGYRNYIRSTEGAKRAIKGTVGFTDELLRETGGVLFKQLPSEMVERIGDIGRDISDTTIGRATGEYIGQPVGKYVGTPIKNKAIKVNNFGKNIRKNTVGAFGSGLETASDGVNTKVGKVLKSTGKAMKEVGDDGVLRMLKGRLKGVVTSLSSKNPMLRKLLGGAADEIVEKAAKQGVKKAGGLAFKGIAGKLLAPAAVAYDFATGMHDVRNIFQIPSDVEPSSTLKYSAGLSKAISNFAFGLIPQKWLGGLIYKTMATKDEQAALGDHQSKMKVDFEDFKKKQREATGMESNMTFEDYNNQQNKTFWSKTVDKVKGVGKFVEENKYANFAWRTVQAASPGISAITATKGLTTKNTRKNLGLAKDQKVSLGQRMVSYLATMIEKLTFGTAKAEEIAKPIHGALLFVKDIMIWLKDWAVKKVKGAWDWFKKWTSKINKFFEPVRKAIKGVWDFAKKYFPFLETIESWFSKVIDALDPRNWAKGIKDGIMGSGLISKLTSRSEQETSKNYADQKLQEIINKLPASAKTSINRRNIKERILDKSLNTQQVLDKYPEFKAHKKDLENAIKLIGKGEGSATTNITNNTFNGMGYTSKNGNVPYFAQTDSRWKNVGYGNQAGNMADSGCGPSAAAMVAATYGSKANPLEAASFSVRNGFRTNGGTTDNYFTPYLASHGVASKHIPVSGGSLASELSKGRPVILGGVGDGAYTKSGHYVVATGMKNGKVSVNDPRGKSYNKKYDINDLVGKTKVAIASGKPNMTGRGEEKPKLHEVSKELQDIMTVTSSYLTAGILGEKFVNPLEEARPDDPIEFNTNTTNSNGLVPETSNAAIAWNFLKRKGFSDAATAGILGNLQQESQLDPRRKQSGGGKGRGLMQWSVGGRWDLLVADAKKNNRDPYDMNTQLDYMWREMNGLDPTGVSKLKARGGMETLKNTNDVKQAVRIFEESFERAGIPNYPRRYEYANNHLNQFGGRRNSNISTGSTLGENMLNIARLQVGKPYLWGAEGKEDWDRDGDTRDGFDCSGLIGYAAYKSGFNKGRGTAQTYLNMSNPVSRNQLRTGDLGFVKKGRGDASHIGFYDARTNTWVHAANSKRGVVEDPGNSKLWTNFGRFKGMGGTNFLDDIDFENISVADHIKDGVISSSELDSYYKTEENDVGNNLINAVTTLKELELINSPDYWLANAKPGKQVRGNYIYELLKNVSRDLGLPTTGNELIIDNLIGVGLDITQPSYWKKNIYPWSRVDGGNTYHLLNKITKFPALWGMDMNSLNNKTKSIDEVYSDSELGNIVKSLASKGVISSPEYWLANARPGGKVSSDYIKGLLQNTTQSLNLGTSDDLGVLVDRLTDNGLTLYSPEYWKQNIKTGGTSDGEFSFRVLSRVNKLLNTDNAGYYSITDIRRGFDGSGNGISNGVTTPVVGDLPLDFGTTDIIADNFFPQTDFMNFEGSGDVSTEVPEIDYSSTHKINMREITGKVNTNMRALEAANRHSGNVDLTQVVSILNSIDNRLSSIDSNTYDIKSDTSKIASKNEGNFKGGGSPSEVKVSSGDNVNLNVNQSSNPFTNMATQANEKDTGKLDLARIIAKGTI